MERSGSIRERGRSMVLIDMEMPKNCAECPCFRHDNLDGIDGYQCNLTLDTWDVNANERWASRGSNCPLVYLSDGLYQVEKGEIWKYQGKGGNNERKT